MYEIRKCILLDMHMVFRSEWQFSFHRTVFHRSRVPVISSPEQVECDQWQSIFARWNSQNRIAWRCGLDTYNDEHPTASATLPYIINVGKHFTFEASNKNTCDVCVCVWVSSLFLLWCLASLTGLWRIWCGKILRLHAWCMSRRFATG